MKYLITGLGNIGSEYWGTRHNIGSGCQPSGRERRRQFHWGAIRGNRTHTGEKLWLDRAKAEYLYEPQRQRRSVLVAKENIPVENLLIVVDDLALPFGTLRLKPKGSDAGHNGLKNIAQLLNTQEYSRLRFGIGSDFPRGGQIDYVLGKFPRRNCNWCQRYWIVRQRSSRASASPASRLRWINLIINKKRLRIQIWTRYVSINGCGRPVSLRPAR